MSENSAVIVPPLATASFFALDVAGQRGGRPAVGELGTRFSSSSGDALGFSDTCGVVVSMWPRARVGLGSGGWLTL
jgi:hypothetical protein